MFICDIKLKEITFFDGENLKNLNGDFDVLYSAITKKYPLLQNIYIGKGSFNNISNQNSFFYSFLYEKWFEISSKLYESLGLKKLLHYFYGYTIEDYQAIEKVGIVEIYGFFNSKEEIEQINTEQELITKSFFVDMVFDDVEKTFIAYARFPLIWGNYTEKSYLDTSSIGVDRDQNIAYQKALSEAIERVSASYSNLFKQKFGSLSQKNQQFLNNYKKYDRYDIVEGNYYYSLYGSEKYFLPEYITYYPTQKYYDYDSNSSGMATHIRMKEAKLGAMLELIERDSFLYSWLIKSSQIKKIDQNALESLKIEISKSDFSFSFFLLESLVPIPTVLMIMGKDQKHSISLATDFELGGAIKKAYQEGINSKPLFEKETYPNVKGVMEHIYYYLNPKHQDKLSWILDSHSIVLDNINYSIKNYEDLLKWFENNNIDIMCYEYTNHLNTLFGRKTFRCYSSHLLPIYFGNKIPGYIVNHTRLKNRLLNNDLHPLG